MKIIRVLWGNDINHEIPPCPLMDNEVVYVWGDENNQMMIDRGMGKTRPYHTSFLFEGKHNTFGKKLLDIKRSNDEFGEVLLLDWGLPFNKTFR